VTLAAIHGVKGEVATDFVVCTSLTERPAWPTSERLRPSTRFSASPPLAPATGCSWAISDAAGENLLGVSQRGRPRIVKPSGESPYRSFPSGPEVRSLYPLDRPMGR
jgi:hypothetical protein